MPLTAGHRIGAFEVIAPLGAGGMGEVYRARDTRLGRDVALKSLPPGYAADPERLARFEREARLLAALSHPNIAGIHGLEDAGGTPYLVLEIVEGESLAARLSRGALSVREVIEIGSQIAGAIEAAHERGIVHRDLKPGNVMISASRAVKVLDFGLARDGALEAVSSPSVSASPTLALSATGTGVILGTAPYMSPEQARGQRVDRRADVWAFGCILFECLSGRQCFAGETVSDVIARILEREPDWNALPAATPKRLSDLVRRCLTKDPDQRPRDIGDLKRELAAIAQELSTGSTSSAGVTAPPSLAVLYFENLAKDPDSEYFCSGITEDILTDLSKIKGLRVASRNAVSRYRGSATDIAKVGAELGVRAVLEGSVRRAGERVRISAQLINAADGFQLWAERYDRKLDDVFAVQEEIASSIAEALRVTLSPAETQAIAQNKPQDVRAYDLYLKGRELYGRYNEASLREALALFQQATEVDPGYALAWAGISDCYGQLCQWGKDSNVPELTRMGLEAARRAISLNPRLPEGYKAEALNLRFAGDRDGSRAALERAVEVNPRFAPAILNLAVHDFCNANLAGAERRARRAVEIDPQDAFATTWIGWICTLSGRPEEAITTALQIRKLTGSTWYVTNSFQLEAMGHLMRGETDKAEQRIREGLERGADAGNLQVVEALVASKLGRMDLARERFGGVAGGAGINGLALQLAAMVAMRLGDPDRAMSLLGRELIRELGQLIARLEPDLHPLLDRPPFAPRRWNTTLVWPLEAPMLSAAVFPMFREVRIESGRPEASSVGSPAP